MNSSKGRAIGLPSLCLALVLVAVTAPAGAAVKPKITESYQALQGQINSGQVRAATFNKKAHTVHVTLASGKHELVSYPSRNEPQLAAQLQGKGAAVKVTKVKKKAAVHHRLRYIAAGVLVALIVIVAVVLGLNRRRPSPEEPVAPSSGAPATAPPPPEPEAPPRG